MEGTFNTGRKMVSSFREATNVSALEERRAHRALSEFFTKSATRFDPSQMSEWESTKPWNLTPAEAEAQLVDGWWGKSSRGSESASWEKGYIRPSPEFFTHPESARRAIAYHEAGHALIEAAGGLGSLDDPLSIIDLPGAQSLSYNAEEIIAEAFSVLWTEPEWFDRMGAHEVRDITIAMAKRAGFPLPRDLRTGALATQLYWRTQPNGRPFSPEDATSTTFQGGLYSLGYSCFDSPWHLWLYLDAMRWYETAKGQDIIGFTGTRVGTGNDGEDLVVPDMRTVRRMSLSAFEAELATTPLPPTPTFGPGWDGYSSWKTLARTWGREFEVGDNPLVDIILKQGSTKTGAETVTLYHGTDASRVQSIRSQGLTPPPGKGSMNGWYMLTTDFDQAARYAMGGSPVVVEYSIPKDRVYGRDHDGPGDLLWPGEPHTAYDFDGVAYAPRTALPGSLIVRVHQVGTKTAMPSWRGLVNGPVWTEYPGVILVDKAGRVNTYEVYINGEQIARAWKLDEAKSMIEAKIGPCEFKRLRQDPIKTDTFAWGTVDWFGDPKIAYAAIPV